MTPQTFSCFKLDRVEVKNVFVVVLLFSFFLLSNSPGFLMLDVDNCGFLLWPSENNQKQEQDQF